jgi:penicillin-binding protein 1B
MNIPTVKIGMRVGMNHVRETLLNIGLDKEKVERQIYPLMLLGTIELTPFEVTQMYTSLATEGQYKDLTTLSNTGIKNLNTQMAGTSL